MFSALAGGFFTTSTTWEISMFTILNTNIYIYIYIYNFYLLNIITNLLYVKITNFYEKELHLLKEKKPVSKKTLFKIFAILNISDLIEGSWFLVSVPEFQYTLVCFLVKNVSL